MGADEARELAEIESRFDRAGRTLWYDEKPDGVHFYAAVLDKDGNRVGVARYGVGASRIEAARAAWQEFEAERQQANEIRSPN